MESFSATVEAFRPLVYFFTTVIFISDGCCFE